MKENVLATRDIRKGEPLLKCVQREEGFFYFFTKQGDAMRAPFARKTLTPEERAQRQAAEATRRQGVEQRRKQREARRAATDEAKRQTKEAARRAKQAALDSRIAELQEKKAKV